MTNKKIDGTNERVNHLQWPGFSSCCQSINSFSAFLDEYSNLFKSHLIFSFGFFPSDLSLSHFKHILHLHSSSWTWKDKLPHNSVLLIFLLPMQGKHPNKPSSSSGKGGGPGSRKNMSPDEYRDYRRAKNTESARRIRENEKRTESEMNKLMEENERRIQHLERQAHKLSKELGKKPKK